MPVVPFGGILATVVFFVLCRLPWAASLLSAFPFGISSWASAMHGGLEMPPLPCSVPLFCKNADELV
jgi:hypothetical protein